MAVLTSFREELQNIFDDQVNKMYYLIDRQLQLVRERHAREQVVRIICSIPVEFLKLTGSGISRAVWWTWQLAICAEPNQGTIRDWHERPNSRC